MNLAIATGRHEKAWTHLDDNLICFHRRPLRGARVGLRGIRRGLRQASLPRGLSFRIPRLLRALPIALRDAVEAIRSAGIAGTTRRSRHGRRTTCAAL